MDNFDDTWKDVFYDTGDASIDNINYFTDFNLPYARERVKDFSHAKFNSLFDEYVGKPLDYGSTSNYGDIADASYYGFLENNKDAGKYHELAMYDALKAHPWTSGNRFFGGLMGLASAPIQIRYDMVQNQSPWSQLLNRSKGSFKYMMSPIMESMRLEPEILRAKQDVNRHNVHNQLLNQRPSKRLPKRTDNMRKLRSRISPSGDVMAYGLRKGGIASL